MIVSKLNLIERLGRHQETLENALNNSDLNTKLALFNYPTERILEGKTLLEVTLDAEAKKMREYGEQYRATDNLDEQWENLKHSVITLRQISRVIFKENAQAYSYLELPGRLKTSRSGVLVQAQTLLKNIAASDEIRTALEAYGYSDMKIAEIQEQILAFFEYKVVANRETTEAQEATRKRDAELDHLDNWMGDFIAIARIAVADQPELLELLGYTVSNDLYN